MFKFNFRAGEKASNPESENDFKKTGINYDDNHSCHEVAMSEACLNCVFTPVTVGSVSFSIRDIEAIDERERNFTLQYKNCDVIPKIYEGGLKVWECTYDLLLFLMQNEINFVGKTVLDLGCGAGLLGIYSGMKGAETVHFQDFNADVLKSFTIPNVTNSCITSKTKFISGDWNGFLSCAVTQDISYDWIVCSEILYCAENYEKLHEVFVSKLQKNGKILIATKSYYFGVGGSVQQFQECLNKHEELKWRTIWRNTEGVQREILSIELAAE